METLASAQVAQEMRGRRAERIMARVQARTSLVDGDPQGLILRAPQFELLPIAGGQQHAVAIEDVAAGDLAGDGVDARIVLRARDIRGRASPGSARRTKATPPRTPPAPRRSSAAVRGTMCAPPAVGRALAARAGLWRSPAAARRRRNSPAWPYSRSSETATPHPRAAARPAPPRRSATSRRPAETPVPAPGRRRNRTPPARRCETRGRSEIQTAGTRSPRPRSPTLRRWPAIPGRCF